MSLEKRVISQFLQLYKEFTCLWDNRQISYSNRETRESAYEALLEKYLEIHEDATLQDVKKKIEYMRATYRREHKKVLLSRINGDVEEYVPQLWYYENLTFLNEVADFKKLEPVPRGNGNISLKTEYEEHRPKHKRRKVSTVYLPEREDINGEEDNQFVDQDNCLMPDNDSSLTPLQQHNDVEVTEAESFGKTVGLQLKELDPIQRVVAEKLISDVMFNARLNRLTVNSIFSV